MDAITLDEFIKKEKARLDDFRTMWEAEMAKGETAPDGELIFPAEMPHGEWDAQLMSHEMA